MELSINTLVVLILGIILVGGGLAIMTTIQDKSEELLQVIDQSSQDKITALFARGELVAIPQNVVTGDYGTYRFTVGVKNKLLQEHQFKLEIQRKQIITPEGDVRTPSLTAGAANYMPEVLADTSEFTLGVNAEKLTLLGITVPKGSTKGTYEYTVRARYNEQGDDTLSGIYGDIEKTIRVHIQ